MQLHGVDFKIYYEMSAACMHAELLKFFSKVFRDVLNDWLRYSTSAKAWFYGGKARIYFFIPGSFLSFQAWLLLEIYWKEH